MRCSYILLGLALLHTLTACNRQPSLVGQWQTELPNGVDKVSVDFNIQKDSKWTGVIKTKEVSAPGVTLPAIIFDASGVWQNADAGKITFSTTTVKAENMPASAGPFEQVLDNALESGLNKYNQAAVKFVDDKTATLTASDGTVMTLTRKA